jgi:Flp pilus assembly pilin Flp
MKGDNVLSAIKRFCRFARDARGIATIEWVMISAVVVVASIAITSFVLNSAGNLGVSVANKLNIQAVNNGNGGNGGDGD